jgi:hypothetical protein
VDLEEATEQDRPPNGRLRKHRVHPLRREIGIGRPQVEIKDGKTDTGPSELPEFPAKEIPAISSG